MGKIKILMFVLIFILLLNSIIANQIDILPKENKDYVSIQEYSYIEGWYGNRNLHSYIGIDVVFKNLTKESNKNITLVILPVNQARHSKVDKIKLLNISFCKGHIDRGDYKISLKNCRGEIKDIIDTCSSRDLINRKIFECVLPYTLLEEDRYGFYIEYMIENFIVKQGDNYIFIDMDELPEGADKTIILPQKALIKTLPEKTHSIISEDERWVISLNKASRSGRWYFLIYEIIPWYKGFLGYLIAFLSGGLLLYFFSNRSQKKHKEEIISKIRTSLYNIKNLK